MLLAHRPYFSKEFNRRAGFTELIVYTDFNHRNRTILGDNICNSRAEAANNAVLLCRNDQTGFFRRFDDDILINRLNGVNVDDARIDSPLLSEILPLPSDSLTIRPVAIMVTSEPDLSSMPFAKLKLIGRRIVERSG